MERTWKPKTAGILTIIAGCIGIGSGAWITLVAIPLGVGGAIAGGMAGPVLGGLLAGLGAYIGMVGGGAIALGVFTLICGIFALRRSFWGLAFAGAICAILLATPLGILSIIFVSLGRREFE